MEYPEYPFSALLHHFVIAIFIFMLRLIQISLLQNNCNALKINCSKGKNSIPKYPSYSTSFTSRFQYNEQQTKYQYENWKIKGSALLTRYTTLTFHHSPRSSCTNDTLYYRSRSTSSIFQIPIFGIRHAPPRQYRLADNLWKEWNSGLSNCWYLYHRKHNFITMRPLRVPRAGAVVCGLINRP